MIEEKDLAEFISSIFTGVTVGVGAQILLFSSGATVLVQCPFECVDSNKILCGHGEEPASSSVLWRFLNQVVMSVELTEDNVLSFNFANGGELRINPEANGMESYVVTTRFGINPVILS